MKSEWEFTYETRGFKFDKELKYKVLVSASIRLGNRPLESIEPIVRIAPLKNEPPSGVDQVGNLYVLLPGTKNDTRDFALYVARLVADRVTFQQGDFRLQYGLISCKRIAETATEEAAFGDELWSVELRLREVLPTPTFDGASLTQTPQNPRHVELIAQFNDAKRNSRPIEQYLGFFKVLESIFHSGKGRLPLKEAFSEDSRFQEIFACVVQNAPLQETVSKLVEVRHACAHLKLGAGFGYAPNHPKVDTEVKPLIPIVAKLAYMAISGVGAEF